MLEKYVSVIENVSARLNSYVTLPPCEITFVNEAILKDRQRRERLRPSLEILLTQNIGADSDNLWRFHHFYGDCLLLPVNRAPLYPRPSFPAPLWTENGPPPLPRDNFFPTETDRSWVGVQTYVQESYVWNRWQEQEE